MNLNPENLLQSVFIQIYACCIHFAVTLYAIPPSLKGHKLCKMHFFVSFQRKCEYENVTHFKEKSSYKDAITTELANK